MKLLLFCEEMLNEESREAVSTLEDRPRRLSGLAFFREHAYAVLVSGQSAKGTDSWIHNCSFWSTFSLRNCATFPPSILIQRLRVERTTKKANKLRAIHALGRDLAGRRLDYVARKYFLGNIRTSSFGESHVKHLTGLKLPWIKETNARFIIRNLGGEDLKPDRWIMELMKVFQSGRDEFISGAKELDWRIGYLDLVLWRYCVQEIKRVQKTREHFHKLGKFGVCA